ncbi:hypothetical protein K502DRAFT_342874 [Neoconidiobolus thromboides FSU 785]|nr:hypothetical protein K502DRAFT_342874 [Neoconidiobolus thromboides FSU 785]
MPLTPGQSIQIVIAVIGLILNLLVGWVVSYGLKLKSTDLVLILIIAIGDSYYYLHNIIRMVLVGTGYLIVNPKILNPTPSWWCHFDATVDMTVYLFCIELVAILSFMRYLSICKKMTYNPKLWYGLSLLSFLSNLGFSLAYIINGFYKWSDTELVCVPTKNPETWDNLFETYYYLTFGTYVVRSIISLLVISFSYFNMTSSYYQVISSSGTMLLKDANSSTHVEQTNPAVQTSRYVSNNIEQDYTSQQKIIRNQKWLTVIKLMGAVFAYSISVIPDMVLNILILLSNNLINLNIDYTIPVVTSLLLSCYGLINAVFVLSSHDPSRRYLLFKMECLITDFKVLLNLG